MYIATLEKDPISIWAFPWSFQIDMTASKFVLAIFLLLALLGLVFAAKDLSKDTDGDGLKDHVDDYDDDNDNIPDIHDEDDDGDGLLDEEVSQLQYFCLDRNNFDIRTGCAQIHNEWCNMH